jgi:hypothetical protein
MKESMQALVALNLFRSFASIVSSEGRSDAVLLRKLNYT